MKKLGWRSLIFYLLVWTPNVFADGLAAHAMVAAPVDLDFKIEFVEPSQEASRVQEIEMNTPDAEVNVIKEVALPEGLPQNSQKPTWKKGVLVTVTSATSFASSYFLFSYDLSLSAKLFGVAMVVNGYQVLATSSWQNLLRRGGLIAKKALRWSARMIGKSIEAGKISDGVGRLFAAVGFNTGVAGIILGLNGAMDSAWMIATMGALGTWDTIWDLAVDKQVENGRLKQDQLQKIIRYRLTAAPPVEAIAYSATSFAPAAAVTMALVGSAGLVSYFADQKVSQMIDFRSRISCKNLLNGMTFNKNSNAHKKETTYRLDTSDIN